MANKQTRHFEGAFDIVTKRSKKLRHVRAIVENTSHAVLNLSKYAQQIDCIVFSYYTFKCILAITTTTIFEMCTYANTGTKINPFYLDHNSSKKNREYLRDTREREYYTRERIIENT